MYFLFFESTRYAPFTESFPWFENGVPDTVAGADFAVAELELELEEFPDDEDDEFDDEEDEFAEFDETDFPPTEISFSLIP